MTDIVQYQDRALAVRDHQTQAVHRLSEWAQSAQAAMVVAEQLSRSPFVPDQFRGKPADCTAAILAGLEIGLQPMAALRSFDIIGGQAAARAITLRAVVQAHGHEIVLVESTATRCKMKGQRAGSTQWQTVDWTMDRAKGLKLDGKDNWRKQPQAMLVARATSELCRLVASDALLGIPYSSEELADGAGAGIDVPAITTADPSTPDAPTAPSGTRRMSRRKPTEEPPADADVIDAEVVEPDGVTDAQIKKMIVSFKEAGITDRQDRLDYITAIAGRDVASSKGLTKTEASQILDMLARSSADEGDG
jgi:hypothetical protein